MKNLSHYKKRILVAVSGLSPAILTETLYALSTKKEDAFIPTEIHLITTLEGKQRAENTLLKGDHPKFKSFCEDYALKGIEFNATQIHVIENKQGQAQNDIRTPEDNEDAADFITRKIFDFTRDDDCALHVSIAGGRKTMGYYVGYALSLFGRQQDRLSHVLVDSDYERCLDFFYPTRKTIIKNNLDKKPVDLSQANVYLAEIPFVRMAPYMPDSDQLKSGVTSFSESVALAQSASTAKNIKIDALNNEITVGQYKKKWQGNESELSFYIWFINCCLDQGGELESPAQLKDDENKYTLDYNDDYAKYFIATYRKVSPQNPHITRALYTLDKGMNYGFFGEKKSRANSALRKMFGPELASRFEIKQVYIPVPGSEKNTKKEKSKKKAGHFNIGFTSNDLTLIYP